MNFRKRLSLKFLSQLLALLGVLGIIVIISILYVQDKGSVYIEPAPLLKEAAQNTVIRDNSIDVASDVLQKVSTGNGWLQILNAQGQEIYQYHKPSSIPSQFSPGQLVYYHKFPSSIGYRIYTWYRIQNGQSITWLYGVKFSDNQNLSDVQSGRFWLYILAVSIIVIILAAFLFGIRLGVPIIHILDWLQNISEESYSEPVNKKGQPRSLDDSGRLRRSYKTYQEVITALERVTNVLKRSQEERLQLEKTREEWVTGVSHDLKTPLSSIKGYAKLLTTPEYDFDKDEVYRFIQVIDEKAEYMENLIEDLNLTFMLKNNALPLKLEDRNVIEIVRRSVIDAVNNQRSVGRNIEFENLEEEQLRYPLDVKWFKRAIDNLLANAIHHNPPGTKITLRVDQPDSSGFNYHGIIVKIQDNGIGMDEQTLAHLFDRYYRGTNTEDGKITGNGLGTAIAKQLIEAQGGSIAVYSSPGEGTKIYITLPPKN